MCSLCSPLDSPGINWTTFKKLSWKTKGISQRYLTPSPYRTTHSHFSSRKVSLWGKSPSPADADTSQEPLEQYLLLLVSLDLSGTSCPRTPTCCSSLSWGLGGRLYHALLLTFLGSRPRTARAFPCWSWKSSNPFFLFFFL